MHSYNSSRYHFTEKYAMTLPGAALRQVFEEHAQRIRELLRSSLRYSVDFFPPPFIVEFTGSPSSEKTTTIKQIYNFLRRHQFEVLMPQEGAEVIPARMRTLPDYNVQTAIYALSILLRESREHRYDFVLFDRCVFDAYHWFAYWHEKGMLTQCEKEVFQDFFLVWSGKINLAYIMVCDPNIAIGRENEIALSDRLGETTNPASIAKMIKRFSAMYTTLSPQFPQLRLVDTSRLNKQDMVLPSAQKYLKPLIR